MLAIAATARAQVGGGPLAPAISPNVQRFDRQLERIRQDTTLMADQEVPAGRRALFDYGGWFTPAYLSLDDFNNNTHVLRQYDLFYYGRLNFDGAHEFYFRGRTTYFDFNPGDSFDGEGSREETVLDRAYYRFDLQRAMAAYQGKSINENLVFQGGRELVYWANGLVLNQVLDGAVLQGSLGSFDMQLLAGLTPVTTTVDFDSSRPNFDDHTRRGFFGAMIADNIGTHKPYVYILSQRDYNSPETLITGPITTHFDYNSYYIGGGSTGSIGDKLTYGAELAFEAGHGLSNSFTTAGGALAQVPQSRDPISAFGADMRLDYLFSDEGKSRASAEVILATGDKDRRTTSNTFGGSAPHTYDTAFNAFGLLNSGLAFNPAISNLMALRLGASTIPLPNNDFFGGMQVGFDMFVYGKFTNGAPIDEPALGSGQFLGLEPDVYMNWQIASDLTFAVRYGAFFPNDKVLANPNIRQFFYAGLTLAF